MKRRQLKTGKVFLNLFGIFICFFSLYIDDTITSVISISLFGLFSIICYNDRRFSDPVAMFSLFYVPYSTWFVYNLIFTGAGLDGDLAEAVNLSLVGLVGFVLTASTIRFLALPASFKEVRVPTAHSGMLAKWLTILAASVLVWALVDIAILRDLAAKREIVDERLISTRLASFAGYVVTVGLLAVWWREYKNRGIYGATSPVIICLLGLLTMMILVLGERDMLFRAVFGMMVIYFSVNRRASVPILLLGLGGVILAVPLTQSAKAILVGDSMQSIALGSIFTGEFLSALRNTYMLVHHGVEHSYSFLATDFLRSLTPLVNSEDVISTTVWYDTVFRVQNDFEGASGWGFGLVAQGFLIDGMVGVVIILASVSILLHALYYMRTRSDLWFIFYALSLATAIYCIRADIANLLSQTFKTGGLAVLTFYLVGKVHAALTMLGHKQHMAATRAGR